MKERKSKKRITEPQKRRSTTCLLVITHSPARQNDGRVKRQRRQFFTPKKNYNYLIEFAKAFAAEIYLVKARNVTILPLDHLTQAFCNPSYDEQAEYSVIDDLTPKGNSNLVTSKDRYNSIQQRIRDRLLRGHSVTVQDLKMRIGVSESTIRRHLTIVRNDLNAEGHKVTQPRRGYYQIN